MHRDARCSHAKRCRCSPNTLASRRPNKEGGFHQVVSSRRLTRIFHLCRRSPYKRVPTNCYSPTPTSWRNAWAPRESAVIFTFGTGKYTPSRSRRTARPKEGAPSDTQVTSSKGLQPKGTNRRSTSLETKEA